MAVSVDDWVTELDYFDLFDSYLTNSTTISPTVTANTSALASDSDLAYFHMVFRFDDLTGGKVIWGSGSADPFQVTVNANGSVTVRVRADASNYSDYTSTASGLVPEGEICQLWIRIAAGVPNNIRVFPDSSGHGSTTDNTATFGAASDTGSGGGSTLRGFTTMSGWSDQPDRLWCVYLDYKAYNNTTAFPSPNYADFAYTPFKEATFSNNANRLTGAINGNTDIDSATGSATGTHAFAKLSEDDRADTLDDAIVRPERCLPFLAAYANGLNPWSGVGGDSISGFSGGVSGALINLLDQAWDGRRALMLAGFTKITNPDSSGGILDDRLFVTEVTSNDGSGIAGNSGAQALIEAGLTDYTESQRLYAGNGNFRRGPDGSDDEDFTSAVIPFRATSATLSDNAVDVADDIRVEPDLIFRGIDKTNTQRNWKDLVRNTNSDNPHFRPYLREGDRFTMFAVVSSEGSPEFGWRLKMEDIAGSGLAAGGAQDLLGTGDWLVYDFSGADDDGGMVFDDNIASTALSTILSGDTLRTGVGSEVQQNGVLSNLEVIETVPIWAGWIDASGAAPPAYFDMPMHANARLYMGQGSVLFGLGVRLYEEKDASNPATGFTQIRWGIGGAQMEQEVHMFVEDPTDYENTTKRYEALDMVSISGIRLMAQNDARIGTVFHSDATNSTSEVTGGDASVWEGNATPLARFFGDWGERDPYPSLDFCGVCFVATDVKFTDGGTNTQNDAIQTAIANIADTYGYVWGINVGDVFSPTTQFEMRGLWNDDDTHATPYMLPVVMRAAFEAGMRRVWGPEATATSIAPGEVFDINCFNAFNDNSYTVAIQSGDTGDEWSVSRQDANTIRLTAPADPSESSYDLVIRTTRGTGSSETADLALSVTMAADGTKNSLPGVSDLYRLGI